MGHFDLPTGQEIWLVLIVGFGVSILHGFGDEAFVSFLLMILIGWVVFLATNYIRYREEKKKGKIGVNY